MSSTPTMQPEPHSTRPNSERNGIVVLDLGGQYTQLIARRIREQQVFSAVLPCNSSLEKIMQFEPAGIVLSGGPSSLYDPEAPKCDPQILAAGVPVLGICYGMQWITHTLGGKVENAGRQEYGRASLDRIPASSQPESELFHGVPQSLRIWNSHGDHVHRLREGFCATAQTASAIRALEHPRT